MTITVKKGKKKKRESNKTTKESLSSSIISMSGFHICDICDKKTASLTSRQDKALRSLFSF